MRIRTTAAADDDIGRLYRTGFQNFGEARADAYLSGLRELFDLLAANPYLARERAEFRPPVRIHPYGSHLVVYRIAMGELLILRVLAGRQDLERHL